MAAGQDHFEIKFRLINGTDIGPNRYPPGTTVTTLKESILAQWPRENDANSPKTPSDMTLINAGKILDNNATLGESSVSFGELPGVITMHVSVKPSNTAENLAPGSPRKTSCSRCSIL